MLDQLSLLLNPQTDMVEANNHTLKLWVDNVNISLPLISDVQIVLL